MCVSSKAEYAHPLEQVFGNYLPVLAGPVLMQTHSITWLCWLGWRLIATYERHSGYCFANTSLGRMGLLHGALLLHICVFMFVRCSMRFTPYCLLLWFACFVSGEGAKFHDHHHAKNNGNFGSGLDIFDRLAGTRVYS